MANADIQVRCPHCQALYGVTAADMGGSAECEGCGKRFIVARSTGQPRVGG